jgi:hypothetical protein
MLGVPTCLGCRHAWGADMLVEYVSTFKKLIRALEFYFFLNK